MEIDLTQELKPLYDGINEIKGLITELIKSITGPKLTEKPISRRELLQLYPMSATTLWRLVKDGEIPHQRIGNRLYFYLSEVKRSGIKGR